MQLEENPGIYPAIIATTNSLDQGHLHPKLEVPGLTRRGQESNPDLRSGRPAL